MHEVGPITNLFAFVFADFNRCVKSKVQCRGYQPPKPKVFDIANITIPDSGSRLENKYVFYFQKHQHGGNLLSQSQLSTVSFWQTLATQANRHHPAVKAVLVGLGCFHQALCRRAHEFEVTNEHKDYANTVFAVSQYNRAIHLLSNSDPKQLTIEITLTCCLLFAAMTMWIEKISTPIVHAHAGWLLLQDHARAVARGEAVPIVSLQEIFEPNFKRLLINACTFADEFPHKQSPIDEDFELEYDVELPVSFDGYGQALHYLTGILKCVLRTTARSTLYHEAVLGRIRNQLPLYLDALQLTSAKLYRSKGSNLSKYLRPLLIHHRMVNVMLETLPSNDETIFDKYQYDFNFIITEAEWFLAHESEVRLEELKPFHPTLGIIPPLFFTATRCRDPILRRRALDLLHSTAHTERRWTSCMATTLARFVIEQEGQTDAQTSHVSVHDNHRIRLLAVDFSRQHQTMTIQYSHSPVDKLSPLLSTTLPYIPDATIDLNQDFVPMSRKVLRASGYTGVGLFQAKTRCKCGYNDVN